VTAYHAAWAWLGGDDLVAEVTVVERDGIITEVTAGGPVPHDAVVLDGVVIPGLVNAHSHVFHRALRHRTHGFGGDFWRWRQAMLEVAARLDPDTLADLATGVFTEMALAGITTVGEFHYLHHDPEGIAYGDPNAMGHALAHAAHEVGIRLVLLDTCYLRDGFDTPLEGPPRRFGDGDVESWASRVELIRRFYRDNTMVRLGTAAHSVRAVPSGAMTLVAGYAAEHRMPFHVHLSEQTAENDAALSATGLTPTGLLAEAGVLGPATSVVHATHLDADDLDRLGAAAVGVVACPTTEADLGDGLGPFAELAEAGATLAVGSDQQVGIDLFAEARGVELHDRLRLRRRGIHSPAHLLEAATSGGARSLGTVGSGLTVGAPADLVAIATDGVALGGWSPEHGIAGVVFGASASDVTDVVVAGRRIVSVGVHREIDRVPELIGRAVRAVVG